MAHSSGSESEGIEFFSINFLKMRLYDYKGEGLNVYVYQNLSPKLNSQWNYNSSKLRLVIFGVGALFVDHLARYFECK